MTSSVITLDATSHDPTATVNSMCCLKYKIKMRFVALSLCHQEGHWMMSV